MVCALHIQEADKRCSQDRLITTTCRVDRYAGDRTLAITASCGHTSSWVATVTTVQLITCSSQVQPRSMRAAAVAVFGFRCASVMTRVCCRRRYRGRGLVQLWYLLGHRQYDVGVCEG
ncbi:hypothetical protein BaRGS_00028019 [Batillaria attramentaria]|uniref:Uncharacterized protein n=1 Tax=Batillaria attramentaria TaxID=370345 RepID=A0ABD0K1D2_9CAEN